VLENHSVDTPSWNDMVVGLPQPIVQNGHIDVPEAPGLGFAGLDEDVVREHIDPRDPGYFEHTDAWNAERSHDRLWS